MQLTRIHTEDGAVSPVIGVVLMVAITVVLAAVVGGFATGLGGDLSSTAKASIDFAFSDGSGGLDDSLEISHTGGEYLQASKVVLSVSESIQYEDSAGSYTTDADGRVAWSKIHNTDTEVTAGSGVTIYAASGDNLNDATVRVLWVGNSKSTVLGKWEWEG